MERRYGNLKIAASCLENGTEEMQVLMSQIIVVRCEHNYYDNSFRYTAYSPHFRILKLGEMCAEYKALIHKDEAGKITVRFQEIENGN